MVVPPALAYGETGYPPKVPPNATMVYELRIDNSQAPAKVPRRLNGKPTRREGRDEHNDKNRAI